MEHLQVIPLDDISVNPYQPRRNFSLEKLTELANSIKENGLIQPIIVRKSQVVGYELLAGERRLRAAKIAGLQEIPAIVKDLTDQQMMLQAIIENLQRDNLNPIEEALSYQALVDTGMTHDQVAKSLGKSRPYISNSLRLLHLQPNIQEAVIKEKISQAHARLLVPFSATEQEEWLQRILNQELSVRQLEEATKGKKKSPTRTSNKDIFKENLELDLKKHLGLSVHIKSKDGNKGVLQIEFQSQEELHNIIHNLKSDC